MSMHGTSAAGELHVNYRYVLDKMAEYAREGRILDYGCGRGEVVQAARARGLDAYGAEIFYAGSNDREVVARTGLLESGIVREIVDGRLGYPTDFFDLVVNNQVFEHVEDLDAVLAEIQRVLRPGGVLLSLFPTREVIREGHCGIPLLHRLPHDSALTFRYALTLRKLGYGYNHGDKSPEVWVSEFLDWLDKYCFYRSAADVSSLFRKHFGERPQSREEDYIAYRLNVGGRRRLAQVSTSRGLRPFSRLAFRLLGGRVLVSRKPILGVPA